MDTQDWKQFFATQTKPANFDNASDKIKQFCLYHHTIRSRIALVTSGGTSVPLEHNTVRFIDNFSAGTRGSASAENLIRQDYVLIFLHRSHSLHPFERHLKNGLNLLETTQENFSISLKKDVGDKLFPILQLYERTKEANQLLSIEFTTLSDYLFLLREVTLNLSKFGSKALIYLAAAVSDFYIPSTEMSEHKIQSASGPITVTLQIVPKMLSPLVKYWAPNAFIVSFKLETDERLLFGKAKKALEKYNHQLVIANILKTRKAVVWIVDKASITKVIVSEDEVKRGVEIEEKIILAVSQRHEQVMKVTNECM